MDETYATLTQDTPAEYRKPTGFYKWNSEKTTLPKGTRVEVLRILRNRKVLVRPTLQSLRNFEASVDFDRLEDFSAYLQWKDVTDKKGLP